MHISTNFINRKNYNENMKVKVFDEQHELDLEYEINQFLSQKEIKVVDIRFSTAAFYDEEDQVFCFSALILYE